jgi:hypothetical protein
MTRATKAPEHKLRRAMPCFGFDRQKSANAAKVPFCQDIGTVVVQVTPSVQIGGRA